MTAVALVTLHYVNTAGKKSVAKAGTVFDDYKAKDFDALEPKGCVRKATVGEIAEAEAAGWKPSRKKSAPARDENLV
ncbi:hypothetical protein WKW50_16555 [Ochrobactrum sp. GPK 3]